MVQNGIITAVLQRLPTYLNYLKSLPKTAPDNISATTLAAALCMGEVQVRKDLASVSNGGKPKIGYIVEDLINSLEEFLGYKGNNDVMIIGAGKLGKALLDYKGFSNYGMNIVAAFDIDRSLEGKTETGKPILSLDKFDDLCDRLKVRIGIITVPAECAQIVCDIMVKNGIKAIWNFAPIHLKVPDEILVQNENMAVSLAVLANHLIEQLNEI